MEHKLDEWKNYQNLSEEYLVLVNKISSEISSEQRRTHTNDYYENFLRNIQSKPHLI